MVTNGVTQYIGARYVPKFYENSQGGTEWQSGVIYEPLTIVTWNGNSYTSKKPVPATVGDPSAHPEYWAATGNFNAQLEEVMEKLELFPFVTPEDYGAAGDGITDDTSAFSAALSVATRTGRILISYHNATYFITRDLVFSDGVTVCLGGRLLGTGTNTVTVEEYATVNNVVFDKIPVVCNGYHTDFSDCTIRNIESGVALSIAWLTGTQSEENVGRYRFENILIDDSALSNSNNTAIGIQVTCPDVNISNTEVINCRTAYQLKARSCKLTGCTAWINAYMSSVFDETVCYDIQVNGVIMIGCTSDSYALSIKMPGTFFALFLEGFRFINNNNIFHDKTYTFINNYGVYYGNVMLDLNGMAAAGNTFNLGYAGHLNVRNIDGSFADQRWEVAKNQLTLAGADSGGITTGVIRRTSMGYIVNIGLWTARTLATQNLTVNHSGLPLIDQAGMDGTYIVPAVFSDGTNRAGGNAVVTITDGVMVIAKGQVPAGFTYWSDVFFNMVIPLKEGTLA